MELSKCTNVQGLQKGKLQESKQPPGSGGASLRCTAGLALQLHAAYIYIHTRELPAKGGRDDARVRGERRTGGSRTGQLAGV